MDLEVERSNKLICSNVDDVTLEGGNKLLVRGDVSLFDNSVMDQVVGTVEVV